MLFKTDFRGSYAILFVELEIGETIVAEPGAMVSMEGDIEVNTSTGGIFKALKRAFLGGEHFFLNKYISHSKSKISFAPLLPGDIEVIDIKNGFFLQSTSYLASQETISIDTKFGGFKTFFSGEGFFLLKLSGFGKAAISAFGGIYHKELEPGETITVDTGHIVGFDETVKYSVRTFGGIKSTLFGGEGLVVDLVGPGRVYIQTRNSPAFINWIRNILPRDTASK